MRLFRTIFLYLMNNEQVINKLAESKPIRQAARWVASLMVRSSSITENRLSTSEDFVKFLRDMAARLRKQLEDSKDEFKKNPPK